VMLEDGSVVPLDAKAREQALEQADLMSEGALRCLALAYKTDLGTLSHYTGESHEVPLPSRRSKFDFEKRMKKGLDTSPSAFHSLCQSCKCSPND
jgi:magnesium-transporting ATPase (P-type)